MNAQETIQVQLGKDSDFSRNVTHIVQENTSNKTQEGLCSPPGIPCSITCSPLWIIPCCVSLLLN